MHALEILLDAIAKCELRLENTNYLALPEEPPLYVPPTFHYVEDCYTLESDAVFIQAPAAVGKSMTAKYISATKDAPILDLATVPVGANSLRGMIGNDAAIEAFRKGNLPIIVDAMDEGRLISGEQSFEQFIVSTGKLLAEQPRSTDRARKRPKIIFFGRPESADFATLAIQLDEDNLSLCKIELDYFGQVSAVKLIDKYAREEIDNRSDLSVDRKESKKKLLNGIPMNNLKDSYFDAIASALGLSSENLWTDKTGQSFAGYAPVLSTLAIMIGRSDNPLTDRQELEHGAAGSAWDVVSKVLTLVMKREQSKLQRELANNVHNLSSNAYSEEEQLSCLAQLILNAQIQFSGNFQFERNTDEQRYLEAVSVSLREHPFVRGGKAANDVLGAAIAAHAISTGSVSGYPSIGGLSRQPFIWRHLITRELSAGLLIDGHTLGYLLNSFFSDPLIDPNIKVEIRDNDEGGVSVRFIADDVPSVTHNVRLVTDITLDVTTPVTLVQRARNCDIEIADKLIVDGPGFMFSETNRIICGELELRPGTIWVHDKLTVVAREPHLEEPIRFFKDERAYISLSQNFDPTRWPNHDVDRWIGPIQEDEDDLLVEEGVRDFINYLGRLPNRSVVLSTEYRLSRNERGQQWIRVYNNALPYSRRLIRQMVELGIARKASIQSAGTPLVRITFNDVDWDLLTEAFSGKNNTYSELYNAIYRL